jgi:MFS family permease
MKLFAFASGRITEMKTQRSSAQWAIAGVIGVAFMGSGLITPLYAFYQKIFGFSEITLTFVYAAYALGNALALLFFGKLSDIFGRRPVAVASIVAGGAATLLFLFAESTASLAIARVLSGIAVGLASGTGSAWLADRGEDKRRATVLANAANAFGFALGPLLGGLLAQYTAAPLKSPFYVYLAILALVGIGAARAPETIEKKRAVNLREALRPRAGLPPEIRARFVAPAVTVFGTFSLVGFYAALIPTILHRDMHASSPIIAGAVVFLLAALAGTFTILTRGSGKRFAMLSALGLLVPAVVLVLLAQSSHSPPLLVAATIVAAGCWGLGIRGSLQVVNEIAPADRRAEVTSLYYLIGFIGNSIPVIGVGLISAVASPIVASATFGCTIAAFALVAVIIEVRAKSASDTAMAA